LVDCHLQLALDIHFLVTQTQEVPQILALMDGERSDGYICDQVYKCLITWGNQYENSLGCSISWLLHNAQLSVGTTN